MFTLIKGKRRGLSAGQKAELWKRWKAGQSLNEIGRALGKDHVVVYFVLARHGGIAPPARRRSRRVLTLADADWRWPNTRPSRWRRICRFTSPIRRVPGSVAQWSAFVPLRTYEIKSIRTVATVNKKPKMNHTHCLRQHDLARNAQAKANIGPAILN